MQMSIGCEVEIELYQIPGIMVVKLISTQLNHISTKINQINFSTM